MEAFSAVVTTGIYCRPGCSARPKPEHVRSFDLAAAAEAAGYRACLRCRPYRSAQPIGATGPELVCRAVRLIVDGALDEGTEAELGARLGVSGRNLRRLFQAHLGLTPDGLARSRRTHFARRLLDDTDLPVTDVAFAAGFGSVRQLNRACRDVFRHSPRELRARRRASDRLAADGGLRLRLPFPPPFDWDALLAYLAPRAIPGVECVDGSTYRRTITVDGDPGVIELHPGGPDHLVLNAHLPHWENLIHIAERARRIAGLDADPDGAARHLATDPAIGPLMAARPGLRVPGAWDPFETGVRAILGQQVSVTGATTLAGRLVTRLGDPVAGLGPLGLTHRFPSPETVAGADLDGLGLTPARARAIRAFAAAVAGDAVRLDRSVGLDGLVASITALEGLGPWTAHYLALRMGEPDAFPATDLGLQRAFARLAPGPAAALSDAAERWRPWRALAATHLWMAPSVGTETPDESQLAAPRRR
ncbi:MAG TPA: AlkA N-terminal domain-containing protein [Acidimicrobiia bacterium]|jgi:AraC family transcriptional regulator of adaptative response / DNA-3-methyladenine glycosylase II